MSKVERQFRFKPRDLPLGKRAILWSWWLLAELCHIPETEVISGQENIPEDSSYIVAVNHRGWAEVPALLTTWDKWIFFMAKKGSFKSPVLYPILKAGGMVPVKRDAVDRAALKSASEAISGNKVWGMMYEGHRGRGDEITRFKPAKRGTAKIAIDEEVAIVPVGVVGSENYAPLIDKELWRIPEYIMRFRRSPDNPPIRIAIGEPIEEHLDWKVERGTGEYSPRLTELTEIIGGRIRGLVEKLESS